MSENFAVSYSNDSTPSRPSSSYFARITSGIPDSAITPLSLIALRASRRTSVAESPTRLRTSRSTTLFVVCTSRWPFSAPHSPATSKTIPRTSPGDGSGRRNSAVNGSSSSGIFTTEPAMTTVQ